MGVNRIGTSDWNADRDQELRRLWATFDPPLCAEILGLTLKEVNKRAEQIGLIGAGFDWTAERVAKLMRRWQAGAVTNHIARELGTTKNAVVGKARRLGLDGRENPIRRIIWTPERRAELTKLHKLGLSASEISTRMSLDKKAVQREMSNLGLTEPRHSQYTSEPKRNKPAKAYRAKRSQAKPSAFSTCQYPFGEVGQPDFRYCGEPTREGSSYCADHHALCYVAGTAKTYPIASWHRG